MRCTSPLGKAWRAVKPPLGQSRGGFVNLMVTWFSSCFGGGSDLPLTHTSSRTFPAPQQPAQDGALALPIPHFFPTLFMHLCSPMLPSPPCIHTGAGHKAHRGMRGASNTPLQHHAGQVPVLHSCSDLIRFRCTLIFSPPP